MNIISREDAVAKIEALRGTARYFGVVFVKRTTGEVREMNCQFDVKKHLQGGELKFNPKAKKLIGPVFDVSGGEQGKENRGYKFISPEGLMKITIDGESFEVK